jgi:transposase, IS5 family
MQQQRTLAMANGFERYGKKTRRAQFLEEMEQIVPWKKLCTLIEPFYPKPGQGRPPIGVERMLRLYFLQQWFNLSDPAVEDALHDSPVMRQFVGIDLGQEPVPDETTVCKFRHLLEQHHMGGEMLETVNLHLQQKGVRITTGHHRGCDHHRGSQFDQEPRAAARPGDAPDQERQHLALRDESACGRRQPDQDDS